MKDVMELARELGEAIAINPVVATLNEAQQAYDTCEPLQKALAEYKAQTELLTEEYKKADADRDETVAEKVKARIEELGKLVVSFKEYDALAKAEKGLQSLMNEVNAEINAAIFGEEPDDNTCTHDCSSCTGCH